MSREDIAVVAGIIVLFIIHVVTTRYLPQYNHLGLTACGCIVMAALVLWARNSTLKP